MNSNTFQIPINPTTGQYDVLPFGVSLEDYMADGTNSYYIKAFTKVISPYFRPGTLSRSECDRIAMGLLSMLVDTVDLYFLKFSARFLTPEDFEEVITERNIVHTCGYPLCAQVPKVCQTLVLLFVFSNFFFLPLRMPTANTKLNISTKALRLCTHI